MLPLRPTRTPILFVLLQERPRVGKKLTLAVRVETVGGLFRSNVLFGTGSTTLEALLGTCETTVHIPLEDPAAAAAKKTIIGVIEVVCCTSLVVCGSVLASNCGMRACSQAVVAVRVPLATREVITLQRSVPVFRGYEGAAAVQPAASPALPAGGAGAPKLKAAATARPAGKSKAAGSAPSSESSVIHPEYHELASIKSYSVLKAEVCTSRYCCGPSVRVRFCLYVFLSAYVCMPITCGCGYACSHLVAACRQVARLSELLKTAPSAEVQTRLLLATKQCELVEMLIGTGQLTQAEYVAAVQASFDADRALLQTLIDKKLKADAVAVMKRLKLVEVELKEAADAMTRK